MFVSRRGVFEFVQWSVGMYVDICIYIYNPRTRFIWAGTPARTRIVRARLKATLK